MANMHSSLKAQILGFAPPILFLTILGLAFGDTLQYIAQSWQKEEYSHGYLIPPLALLLMFNIKFDKAAPAPGLGIGLIVLALTAKLFFQFAGINGLNPQFLLIGILGIVALFWGGSALKTYAAPLTLLFLCLPLPKFLFYTLSFQLQMLSTSLGAAFLTLVGIPVFQDGNILDLGTFKLEVAEACNGIRFLFPLMGVSFLLAAMYKGAMWKRIALFVSSAPITILMNSLRIALVGVTVDLWGPQMAEGTLHSTEGYIVFLGCTAVLFIETALLRKFGKKDTIDWNLLSVPPLYKLPLPAKTQNLTLIALLLLMGATAGLTLLASDKAHVEPVYLAKPLNEFPMKIGDWEGRQESLGERELEVLGTQDYLIADYAKAGETPVNLYILYYPQQDSTSNQAVHNPTVCIPGGGWKIDEQTKSKITLSASRQIDVNQLLISKGLSRQLVLYWFFQNGQTTASPSASRLLMLKSALLNRRTNGGMIRLTTEIARDEDSSATHEKLKNFLLQVQPLINVYVYN